MSIVDFFLHLDHHMTSILETFGGWTYLLLFLIIFCETGLVITPFLPGDSLLFVIGTIAAGTGALQIEWLLFSLSIAAILGDSMNYWIGSLLAPKVFRQEKIRFIKREYLERTEKFYAKYGGKTIIIARFVPIVRTFAPFLAGVGKMSYRWF
ncbi:MAG: VTT domain-containing protein, partial [Candidatus Omnitrophica bacterium]|nr:VTT domain-containing protein [Candidatus Omnitrophota bacterium]